MIISDLDFVEDVSEASSIVGGAFINITIVNGKASIQSEGFKVVKKEVKNKGGNSISITATSSGKSGSSSKVSVTTSTSVTSKKLKKDSSPI